MIDIRIKIPTKLADDLRKIRKLGETLDGFCQRCFEEKVTEEIKRLLKNK